MKELILAVWLFAYLRRQLLLAYWWQVKEYRLDRFWVFLKTPEGRDKTDMSYFFAKLFLLPFTISFKPGRYLYVVLWLGETGKFFFELFSHQLRRPKVTLRGLGFLFASFLFAIVVIFLYREEPSANILLLGDILSYPLLLIPLFLSNLLLKIILLPKRNKAISILKQYQPITIAITGSYGKSSTKHLLFELLNNFAPTVKTPASYNTPLGIIQTINNLGPKTKYFLCEMGAYKRGEIKALCQIAKPDFAVITGICPQHLALFGNMANLIKAKYEVAQNLKPGGTLFVNSSSPTTEPILSLAQSDKIKTVTYALKQTDGQKANFLALITNHGKNLTTLEIKTPSGPIKFITSLTNRSMLENLVGAIAITLTLKLPLEPLKEVVANLGEIESGVKIKKVSPDIAVMDDSFNSNPRGFEAALNTLIACPGFRVVITNGIQELGEEAFLVHKRLGEQLRSVDLILITSPSLIKPFRVGLGKDGKKLHLIKQDIKPEELKRLIKTPATILVEGRLPSPLINNIYKLT